MKANPWLKPFEPTINTEKQKCNQIRDFTILELQGKSALPLLLSACCLRYLADHLQEENEEDEEVTHEEGW